MKCDFCGHEVAPGTVECPYCHYQFKIDAQVLSRRSAIPLRRDDRYIPLAAAAAF